MVVDCITAIAAALAVGLAGIAAAYAEAHVGAAVAGVIGEDEKKFGKALTIMIVPETIAVFGFIIAIILLMM